MLKPVFDRSTAEKSAQVRIADAAFPSPFASGLEYGSPARGTWNIVHTGMLIPEAHQVFVCASCCLRGVVLTAAEMGASDRFSTVTIRENNVVGSGMEDLIIDGTSDVIRKLPRRPRAVLLYTSCIHHFLGCDIARTQSVLRSRFPDIDFTDCYMNPIMRKSGLTPDALMRRQLYSLLRPRPEKTRAVNYIGSDLPLDDSCELTRLIKDAGYELRDLTRCRTYDEYQEMASSSLDIAVYPSAVPGGEELKRRLGIDFMYLPQCFGYDEIEDCLDRAADRLGTTAPDYSASCRAADAALNDAAGVLSGAPVAIDYTAHPCPLGMARLLLDHGFDVTKVYLDSVSGEEKADFDYLRAVRPDLLLCATVDPTMRVLERRSEAGTVAVGQKAAYFCGTDNFVNIIEGGGLYGWDGVIRLAALLTDAYRNKKDARSLIQIKGMGCGCCV